MGSIWRNADRPGIQGGKHLKEFLWGRRLRCVKRGRRKDSAPYDRTEKVGEWRQNQHGAATHCECHLRRSRLECRAMIVIPWRPFDFPVRRTPELQRNS